MASTSIDKRTGNIVVRAYAGTNPRTGKRHYVSKTLPKEAGASEVEEAKARMDALASITKGNPHGHTIETLVCYYLENFGADSLAETTLDSYWSYTRAHVAPRIGATFFRDATALTFSAFYHDLRRPKEAGGAGLSQSTVKKVHSFLSGCFSTLRREGAIGRNPVADIKVDKGDPPDMRPLSEGDFAALLAHLDETLAAPVTCDADFEALTLAAIFRADSHTGLRRGELCGLQRRHRAPSYVIDEGTGERREVPALRVERSLYRGKARKGGKRLKDKPPKSSRGTRTVSLDPGTDALLDAYASIQETVLAEKGVPVTPDTPLFSHADGSPIEPDRLTSSFKALARELGLDPDAHLHTLRHTHGTYLLDQGESIRDVQERLGHESVETTQAYTHTVEGKDFAGAKRFAANADSMMKRSCNASAPRYAPKCPRTGETCERYADAPLEK